MAQRKGEQQVNHIITFTYEGNTTTEDGEPWFVASDVAGIPNA